MQPLHIGHLGTVPHVLLELGMLALQHRESPSWQPETPGTVPAFFSFPITEITHTSYLHWVGKELHKPKIISCGQEGSVLCETGCVDNGDIAVHGPDSLTGGTKHTCPGVPFNLLYLQAKIPQKKASYFKHTKYILVLCV